MFKIKSIFSFFIVNFVFCLSQVTAGYVTSEDLLEAYNAGQPILMPDGAEFDPSSDSIIFNISDRNLLELVEYCASQGAYQIKVVVDLDHDLLLLDCSN